MMKWKQDITQIHGLIFQLLTTYATLGKIVHFCEPQFTDLCNNGIRFISSKFVESIKVYIACHSALLEIQRVSHCILST